MTEDHRDPADIVHEFSRRKRRQYWAGVPVIGALALVVWAGWREDSDPTSDGRPIAIAGFLIIVCVLAFSFWNWRCPSCRHYLWSMTPAFCPKCGVGLG